MKATYWFALAATAVLCTGVLPVWAADADEKEGDEESVEVPARPPKMYLAISKFEDRVTSNYYDRHFRLQQIDNIRQRITDKVVNTRKFDVIERERIADILKEQSLQDSGITSGKEGDMNTPRAGMIRTCGYIMLGSVLSLGEDVAATRVEGTSAAVSKMKVEVQIRLENVESGKIVASKTVQGFGKSSVKGASGSATAGNIAEQALRDACDDAAEKAVALLMELAFPATVIAVGSKDITINVTEEMCAKGEIWEVLELGDEMLDDRGESSGAAEEEIGRIEITKPGAKFSKARPLKKGHMHFSGSKDLLDDIEVGMRVRRVRQDVLDEERQQFKKKQKQQFESNF